MGLNDWNQLHETSQSKGKKFSFFHIFNEIKDKLNKEEGSKMEMLKEHFLNKVHISDLEMEQKKIKSSKKKKK